MPALVRLVKRKWETREGEHQDEVRLTLQDLEEGYEERESPNTDE